LVARERLVRRWGTLALEANLLLAI
jgi:hypothetical protein